MKYSLCVLLIFFSFAVQAQKDSLIWADEFNGTGAPDPANWSYDLGTNNGWGNNEIENYTNSTTNSKQDSGALVIQALKMGYTWTSARIRTQQKFSFTYGKIIFRAQLPAGSGTWPALWMLGESLNSVGWPSCGEVDVMENAGKNPGAIRSSLHTTSSYGNTVNTNATMITNPSTQYHDFEANWTPEKIEFRVDGLLFYTYNPVVKTSSNWPFNKPFFIIMNLAMGGNFGSDPKYETNGQKNGIDPALTSAKMKIDYVRVYKPVYPASVNELPGDGQDDPGKNLLFEPNPTTGKIRLKLPGQHQAECVIYNLTGTEVFHFKTSISSGDIDISFLPKGMYFLAITYGQENKIQKLVLE